MLNFYDSPAIETLDIKNKMNVVDQVNLNSNWIYDITNVDRSGPAISNSSLIDSLIYAFHSFSLDARIITTSSSYDFTPQSSWKHLNQLKFNTTHNDYNYESNDNDIDDLLKKQRILAQTALHGEDYVNSERYQEKPVNIIVTSGNDINKIQSLFTDCPMMTMKCQISNKYYPLYVCTSKTGAENIKDYLLNQFTLKQHNQIEERLLLMGDGDIEAGIDKLVINASGNSYITENNKFNDSNYNNNNTSDDKKEQCDDKIDFGYLMKILYSNYGLKYISIESGVSLINSLIKQQCMQQLNVTLMHDSLLTRKDFCLSQKIIENMIDCNQLKIYNVEKYGQTELAWIRSYFNNLNTNTDCSLAIFGFI